MPHRINDLPLSERPRERLIASGPGALRVAELLAILLRTGHCGRSAVSEAEELLRDAGGLVELARMDTPDLLARPGIGETKAATLAAAMELARRLSTARLSDRKSLDDPDTAGQYIAQMLQHERREVVGFISLDCRHRLLRRHDLVKGTRKEAPVELAELVRLALLDHAAGILLYHNHPSGELMASRTDIELTRRLATAGNALGIPLLDHIIVADVSYLSLRVSQPALFA